ncbi:MAG: hypothetical protein LUF27_08490 [Lachnospiraceae bacterium]|nr:hypothetical protein [Lachnospiraceae bacterium]
MLAYEQAGIQTLSFTPQDTKVTVEDGLVTTVTRSALDTETGENDTVRNAALRFISAAEMENCFWMSISSSE